MSGTRKNEIVVGVDGSQTSAAAALWAADEAHHRRAKLVVLYAYELYASGSKDGALPGTGPYEEAEMAAATLVDEVVKQVHQHHRDLAVQVSIRHESAGTALLSASDEALLTVVSSHGRSARAEELIGSFAIHTAEHGRGPVAVLRGDTATIDPAGPVVVGADGSAVSDQAIDFAFESAQARKVPLHVVHCRDDGPFRAFHRHTGHVIESTSLDEQLTDLTDALAERVERFADVVVVPAVVRGKPELALREYCSEQAASVLVVGARGISGLAGLLLGSTSRMLLAHSDIPVVVVRPDGAAA